MSDTPPNAIDARVIRETLAGYAAASEYIEQERIERLRRLTTAESHRIYAQLVALHQQWSSGLGDADQEGWKRLEEWRLQTKIATRQAFEGVARAQGLM